jgi:hypothetical protein
VRHTPECADIGALVEMTAEMVRRTQGRGDLPVRVGAAAQYLTVAHGIAHHTCVTHSEMFDEVDEGE